MQTREVGFDDGRNRVAITQQDLVSSGPVGVFAHAQSTRCIALGIGVNDENLQFASGERGCQIDSGRSFTDAAFLIGDREDFAQGVMLARNRGTDA